MTDGFDFGEGVEMQCQQDYDSSRASTMNSAIMVSIIRSLL